MDYTTLPDDELSALVAEQVMEWKAGILNGQCWIHYENTAGFWSPATSIVDAWEVLDCKHAQGYAVSITQERSEDKARVSMAGLDGRVATCKDKLCRAICIAALRATEG